MIGLPEIGIEAAEENASTHGVGAIKHLIGEDELVKEYNAQNKESCRWKEFPESVIIRPYQRFSLFFWFLFAWSGTSF